MPGAASAAPAAATVPGRDGPAGEALLRGRGLCCERGERLLFEDLEVAVAPGEVLQICGPNGSGKTSLLRILCGLSLPTAGEVLWRGHDIYRNGAGWFGEVQYLGHVNGVKLELSPLENLRFAGTLGARPGGVTPAEALQRLGLGAQAETPARALSAGQRRRVALARLLITRARAWILDEPFTSLDRDGGATVENMLREHTAGGGLALLSSHEPRPLDALATRTLTLA